jgi:hypothetical protein|nr:MAG TPA: hypothetical protein [Caudoviricetes sp.]
MVSEEKTEGVIVEGTKHPLTLSTENTKELEIQLKDCLNVIPKTNDLTSVIVDTIKENIELYHKPIRVNYIKRNAYITYKGIKIPTKSLHNQSKNKFINRCVLKNVVPVSVTTEDLSDYKMGIGIKLRYNA